MTTLELETQPDGVVLSRFVRHGDEQAFAVIVHRYADEVFSTCLRVLCDHARAEDATQETFLRLSRKPPTVRESLGGWLHRVACRVSIDLHRSDTRRRVRERKHAEEEARRLEVTCWSELSPVIDQAIDELPDSLRVVLVEHFLQQRTLTAIAAEQGVSTPTMSRRLRSALDQLHRVLDRRGVTFSAITMLTLLSEAPMVMAAPASTVMELNKITMISGMAGGKATGGGIGLSGGLSGGLTGGLSGGLLNSWFVSMIAGAAAFVVIIGAVGVVAMLVGRRGGVTHESATSEIVATVDTTATRTNTNANADVAEQEPGPAASSATIDPRPRVVRVGSTTSLSSSEIMLVQHPDNAIDGQVAVTYGDGRTVSMSLPEARQAVVDQTGRSLASLTAEPDRIIFMED